MAKTAAKIRGIALAPGVSKNGRLYTRENIASAVNRAQDRIKSGDMTMLTHHDADDDSTHVVGRVTKMSVDERGAAAFEAELASTANGKVIKKLTRGPSPFLKGVSIRGQWRGKVRHVDVGGQTAETADDLELLGLDFTHKPGIPDAQILAESAGGRSRGLIFEEAPEAVVAPAGPTAAELAAMPQETFEAAALDYWGGKLTQVRGSYRPASSIGLGGDSA